MDENYEISEKEEFIRLLEDIEKMTSIDIEKFQNDLNTRNMILKYNSLAQIANTFNFTEEERTKVQSLWNSLKSKIDNYNFKLETEKQMSSQELLLTSLKDAIRNWNKYSISEKKQQINKINELQMNRRVIHNMTDQQLEEYEKLMDNFRENATIESITQEEYNTILNQHHRGA